MFRIYENGNQFFNDNRGILKENPLETVFFVSNAENLKDSSQGFAVKAAEGELCLLAIRYRMFPMVLYGDRTLCGELAAGLKEHGLTFGGVLSDAETTEAFFQCYEALAGGTHVLSHTTDMMKCTSARPADTSLVAEAFEEEAEELAELMGQFSEEAGTQQTDFQERTAEVLAQIRDFAVVRMDGKIVSMARKVRETDLLCGISHVFTRREYRGKGFARQTVTALTEDILKQGKLAYLYMDRTNPISNHLYQSIGYEYGKPHIETAYLPAENA